MYFWSVTQVFVPSQGSDAYGMGYVYMLWISIFASISVTF